MTVQDLKKQFHGFFPYLKIEFFETPYKVATGSNKASMIDNKESIGAMLKSMDGGNVELDSLTTVISFEQPYNLLHNIDALNHRFNRKNKDFSANMSYGNIIFALPCRKFKS